MLESGSRPGAAIARELGIARNQLYKWQTELRAHGATAFPGPGARKERTTEVTRLKRELARVTEERDILKKRRRTSPRMCGEVRVHTAAYRGVLRDGPVSGAAGELEWLLCLATTTAQCSHADQPAAHGTDARPPSADAGSLWGSEDVAGAHLRGPGLRPPSDGPTQVGSGDRGLAPTALCPHRASPPARAASRLQSPQPTVCRIREESRMGGGSDIRSHPYRLAHGRCATRSLFPTCRGVGHESAQTLSVVVEARAGRRRCQTIHRGLVHHSDQGNQYRATLYQTLLARRGPQYESEGQLL